MSEVRQVRGVSCVCKLIWCAQHNGWWCLCCNSLQLPGLSARVKQGVTELYDESLSLAAAQTTTDPKNKIQITQRTNALHLRHHHLSKNQLWNVLMIFQKQKCFFLSFSKAITIFVIVSIVTVVGSWLPESLHSPGRRSSFPLISTPGPSSCLTSNSIVSRCVRRKWNAPALIIIAPC